MAKKLLFILPSLKAGGAERIITFISQNIDSEKFDCTLLVIGSKISAAYTTDNVKTVYLNIDRVLTAIPAIFKFIRRTSPYMVLSSINHLNTVMGLISPFFPKVKFVIREASVISFYEKFEKKSSLYGFLAKKAFPKVDAVICQSIDMANDFNTIYNIPKEKLHIINNPITGILAKQNDEMVPKPSKFITIGRLSKEKGHERLLRIISQLKSEFSYTIIGNGPEKETILNLIDDLDLNSKVTHLDYTDKVYEYLSSHDMFLQGSYVEGFPNAVLESCAVGTPVCAFLAPGGTREIIENDINGYLVDTEEQFLSRLEQPKDWERQTVMDSVNEKFSQKKILGHYQHLFDIL